MHKHHIIPKHMGGSDDASNIIELSVEEHAEAHRLLYEKHGKFEDYLAWKGLAGIIGKEEIITELNREQARRYHTGKKRSKETCKKISDALTGTPKTLPKCITCDSNVKWEGSKCKQCKYLTSQQKKYGNDYEIGDISAGKIKRKSPRRGKVKAISDALIGIPKSEEHKAALRKPKRLPKCITCDGNVRYEGNKCKQCRRRNV